MAKLEQNSKLFRGFTKSSIEFLKDLKANNNREWFNNNKDKYEKLIRTPALFFIEDMKTPIKESLSKHFVAIPKKIGGSMMRPYRDTRFSKDKTPYKTNVGIQFRHSLGKDVHAPGFYLHIQPGNCFFGAGIWRPESRTLLKIRDFIADNPKAWSDAITNTPFAKKWEFIGASLIRPPRGFDKEHPLITELRRKDFIVRRSFDEQKLYHPDFIKFAVKEYRTTCNFIDLLCFAIDIPF